MNTKKTLVAAVAAAIVGISGAAIAQITSTPGAGATATCNTLRGGTGAHRPDPYACGSRPESTASITKIEEPVALAPAPQVTETTTVTEMGAPPEPEMVAVRPARADRG